MKPSRTRWVDACWPLVDAKLRRGDCLRIIREAGLPEPRKSACVFCPFHDDAYWTELRTTAPVEFQRAVDFDAAIRDQSSKGLARPIYLHRSLRPLAEVEFRHEKQLPLLAADGFGGECSGTCGV